MDNSEKNTNIIPMLDRGLRLIEELYEMRVPMGISELSRKMQLPKATIYRLLYTLEKNGYVEQDLITEKYELGNAFVKLGQYVKATMDINVLAKPEMKLLAGITGETAYLCKTYYDEALVMETVSGEASALYSMVTPTIPLYCSALGRVLLAGFSDEALKKYLYENGFKKRTINTKTENEDLLTEILKIKKEEIAIEKEEYEYGMTCLAGPIYDISGNIIASLSVSGPTTRIEYKGMEKIIEEVKNTCKKISAKIKI